MVKMSKKETVEVTLTLPKPFMEFLKAIHNLSRVETGLEEWLVQYLIHDIVSSLKGSGIGETFDILDQSLLIKAYNLSELMK